MRKTIETRPISIVEQIRKFHSQEFQDLTKIISNIEKAEDEMRDKQDECQSYLNQIKGKRKENQKYGSLSKGVLEGKSQQIKSKIKNIDSVSTGIKQVVSKIKPQKLSKINIKDERALKKIFKTLYETLYAESEEFNWQSFKKKALKHEGGEDFVSRLVNINFKELPLSKYDKLMELKSDPQFEQIVTKSVHSKDVIDIAEWVDYVCLGHQFSSDKIKLQKEYDKIRKDLDKKSKASLQVSENFWKEASQEIQKYQSQMRDISSELKTMSFEMKKLSAKESVNPISINFGTAQLRA